MIEKIKKFKKIIVPIIIVIVIILILIIGFSSNTNNRNANTKSIAENTTQNVAEQNETKKEYFDFIDVENKTFNFTEEEIMRRICGGKNYTEKGYKKSVAANMDNTNLYTLMVMQGIETINITTNWDNNKVNRISVGYSPLAGNLDNKTSGNLSIGYTYQIFHAIRGGIVTDDTISNKESVNETNSILENLEVVNGEAKGNGIVYNIDESAKGVTVTFAVDI